MPDSTESQWQLHLSLQTRIPFLFCFARDRQLHTLFRKRELLKPYQVAVCLCYGILLNNNSY